MKKYNALEEMAFGQICPQGWLREYLKTQKSGLTGHLENAGFPFDRIGWDRPDVDITKENRRATPWWPYEQVAYWVDGMERCGLLLEDEELLEKADKSIEYVLRQSDSEGYLGPRLLKEYKYEEENMRWAHVVFFRALMAKYSKTGDEQIIEKLTDFYLKSDYDYSQKREVMHVEIMVWLYRVTGDERLLVMAEETFRTYNELCEDDNCLKAMNSRKKAYAHGVTYNEFCKLGAILYSCTGKKEYLNPVIHAYKKIDRYQMLVDGCHCSNEFLWDNDYMESHETCDVTDYSWALGYLLMATGDGSYGDKIERCVFNAGIGSVLENFRGLQYFSCPNQLILDRYSNPNGYCRGEQWMSYRPNPATECCPGNVNRFFPNYCARMWMEKERGICAVLYGASKVYTRVGNVPVEIEEITNYPFEEEIRFVIRTGAEVQMAFSVRIPGWCENPDLKVNGESYPIKEHRGFATISRTFANEDEIILTLPSKAQVKRWGRTGAYVEKGPLLYAFGMKGRREIDAEDRRSTLDFPAYNIYPDKEWNYALSLDEEDLKKIEVTCHEVSQMPWDMNHSPITIRVVARKVPGWTLEEKKKVIQIPLQRPKYMKERYGHFVLTPRHPKPALLQPEVLGEKEMIELVPYGMAKLRLTVFPMCEQSGEEKRR